MADAQEIACAQLVELVTDYLEGALAATERALFEEHLADCDGCVAYLDQMRTTIELTGRLREDDLPPDLQAELVAAFRDWNDRSPG
jgi:predicted anti-sigma-YlaC factor YlaD